MFQIGHVSLTSADTYRRDSYCLARVFQNLPAPPKQYGVFDVFCDFQSFFQLENLYPGYQRFFSRTVGIFGVGRSQKPESALEKSLAPRVENLGSHLAMCPDDRFLITARVPQGKQILPEICQVRPVPNLTIISVMPNIP